MHHCVTACSSATLFVLLQHTQPYPKAPSAFNFPPKFAHTLSTLSPGVYHCPREGWDASKPDLEIFVEKSRVDPQAMCPRLRIGLPRRNTHLRQSMPRSDDRWQPRSSLSSMVSVWSSAWCASVMAWVRTQRARRSVTSLLVI